MVNHECKIDQHTPTDDGEACSCGYFRKAAPESQPHTVHPWDALEAIRASLASDSGSGLSARRIVSEIKAAVEKLPVGVRQ